MGARAPGARAPGAPVLTEALTHVTCPFQLESVHEVLNVTAKLKKFKGQVRLCTGMPFGRVQH